jgi:CHAD domain-containing protein
MADQPRGAAPGVKGVRRMVRKQLGKALAALGAGESPSDEDVHDARKRLKKARAGLRLLREALGPRAYRRENARLRDAAQPLTEVRDAKMLVDTLDKLAEQFNGVLKGAPLEGVRRALLHHKREVRRRVLRDGEPLKPVEEALEAARGRAKDWPAGRRGRAVLRAGLKRVYRAGRDAFAAAREQPTVERLHEWRKQAKYLWLLLEVLQPYRPAALGRLADQAHDLADRLGDDHDLAVLRQKLQTDPGRFPDRPAVDALAALIDRRRAELEEEARRLGRRLYADKPKAFAGRLKGRRRRADAAHA